MSLLGRVGDKCTHSCHFLGKKDSRIKSAVLLAYDISSQNKTHVNMSSRNSLKYEKCNINEK